MKLMKWAMVASAVTLTGCSTYIAPTPVATSMECWPSELAVVRSTQNAEGLAEYRTCIESKSQTRKAFKLENKLERIGAKFCLSQGKYFQALKVRAVDGNYSDASAERPEGPKVELIFACSNKPIGAYTDAKINKISQKVIKQRVKNYEQMQKLQKLNDTGVLSDEELAAERARLVK